MSPYGPQGYAPNAAPQVYHGMPPGSTHQPGVYPPPPGNQPIYGPHSQNMYPQNAPPPMNYYGGPNPGNLLFYVLCKKNRIRLIYIQHFNLAYPNPYPPPPQQYQPPGAPAGYPPNSQQGTFFLFTSFMFKKMLQQNIFDVI